MPGIKKVPMRQCIGCHDRKEKSELVRIVHTPEGKFMYDASGRKNGRGAYICNDRKCLEKAFKTGALSRTFKVNIDKEELAVLKHEMEDLDVK